jgi:hypothetical protein
MSWSGRSETLICRIPNSATGWIVQVMLAASMAALAAAECNAMAYADHWPEATATRTGASEQAKQERHGVGHQEVRSFPRMCKMARGPLYAATSGCRTSRRELARPSSFRFLQRLRMPEEGEGDQRI